MMKLLLNCEREPGVNADARNTEWRETALHRACRFGNLEAVKLLLEYGAEVNAQDSEDNTPLNSAIANSAGPGYNAEMVDLLLLKGADPNIRTIYQTTAMHIACAYGDEKILKYCAKHGGSYEALDECGATLLHYAASNAGTTGPLEFLLTREDVDVDQKDLHGETALDHAMGLELCANVAQFLEYHHATDRIEDKVPEMFQHCNCEMILDCPVLRYFNR